MKIITAAAVIIIAAAAIVVMIFVSRVSGSFASTNCEAVARDTSEILAMKGLGDQYETQLKLCQSLKQMGER